MWKPLITKRSSSAANKQRAAQTSVTLTPGVEEASMASRTGLPKSFLGLVAGAVVLVHMYGFSYREVADVIGASDAAVTNYVHRGLKRLRDVLEREERGRQ